MRDQTATESSGTVSSPTPLRCCRQELEGKLKGVDIFHEDWCVPSQQRPPPVAIHTTVLLLPGDSDVALKASSACPAAVRNLVLLVPGDAFDVACKARRARPVAVPNAVLLVPRGLAEMALKAGSAHPMAMRMTVLLTPSASMWRPMWRSSGRRPRRAGWTRRGALRTTRWR